MHTFFHGWRRKAGCVTLVLALVVMGSWMRSRAVMDVIRFGANGRQQGIVLLDGDLCWWGWDSTTISWKFLPNERPFDAAVAHEHACRNESIDPNFSYDDQRREWIIAYQSITLPLTLLSAYLILWKPRKRPPCVSSD